MPSPEDPSGRVLVVEHDGAARTQLARSLRRLGHVVAEAASSAQALDWTTTWPPDVVLLDGDLPDGGAMTLLARLRGDAVTRDVPVLVATTAPAEPFLEEALRAGAHDYVTKPFAPEELLARTRAALRTKALADELRVLAAHDPLTGLRNRRGVAESLAGWRAHCTRHRVPLAVALLDVNGFTRVNEELSHSAGDRVLRAVAENLSASVRVEDVVGRWGGDEFLVLLPRGDAATAQALLDRVNTRLADQRLLPDRPVTLRAGIAVAAPDDPADDEHLLGRAAVSLLGQRRAPQPA